MHNSAAGQNPRVHQSTTKNVHPANTRPVDRSSDFLFLNQARRHLRLRCLATCTPTVPKVYSRLVWRPVNGGISEAGPTKSVPSMQLRDFGPRSPPGRLVGRKRWVPRRALHRDRALGHDVGKNSANVMVLRRAYCWRHVRDNDVTYS